MLLLLFFQVQKKDNVRLADAVIMGVLGSLALWFSFATLFLIAAGSIYFVVLYFHKKTAMLLFPILFWLFNTIAFALVQRQGIQMGDLTAYWNFAFIPLPSDTLSLQRIGHMFQNFIHYAGIPYVSVSAAVIVFLLGLYHFFKTMPVKAFILVLIFVMPVFASMIQKYPFSGRMVLFLLPIFYIVIASGMIPLFSCQRLAGWIFVLFLCMPFLKTGIELSYKPIKMEEIKPLLEIFTENRQASDALYVYPNAFPAFRVYQPNYNIDNSEFTVGIPDSITLLTGKNIWILYSHLTKHTDYPKAPEYQKTVYKETGAKLVHYEKSSTSDDVYNNKNSACPETSVISD
ncbi:MAG: hypothetical protein U5R06_04465 [candidate division KSB1 bacterium]|nr:hypothetical protein [candidate division KSB1 bacterium]